MAAGKPELPEGVTGSNDWMNDCLHFHGRLLQGDKGHWCPCWDYMPIDETCDEFTVCTCYPETE